MLVHTWYTHGYHFIDGAFTLNARCVHVKRGGDEEDKAKPEEYYHYQLAGVVVHMGTANSGHYYSYIRPRDGGGEWVEFNDTVVSTFDVEVRCKLARFCGR